MNVIIRTDASTEIGTGHVMRCLTLADMLATRGAQVRFICRAFKGNLSELIGQRGYQVQLLPIVNEGSELSGSEYKYAHWLGVSQETDCRQTLEAMGSKNTTDWVVVDHYAIDKQWETAIRQSTSRIMVIDCLANRPHDCNLLLDQNLYTSDVNRHGKWVPDCCRVLVGPQFALLRQEFIQARASLRQRDGQVRRILVQFGGVDASNETSKALEAIISLNRPDINTDVVVGRSNVHSEQIKERCEELPHVTFHCQTKQVANLMAAADLAIGAGGTTHWERCILGLPTLIVVVADNQRPATEALDARGAVWNLGWHEDVTADIIGQKIKWAADKPKLLISMGDECQRIMRGDDSGLPVPSLIDLMKQSLGEQTATGLIQE